MKLQLDVGLLEAREVVPDGRPDGERAVPVRRLDLGRDGAYGGLDDVDRPGTYRRGGAGVAPKLLTRCSDFDGYLGPSKFLAC